MLPTPKTVYNCLVVGCIEVTIKCILRLQRQLVNSSEQLKCFCTSHTLIMQVKEYNKTKKEIIQANQLLFTHPNSCQLAVFFPVCKRKLAASQNLDLRDYHKDQVPKYSSWSDPTKVELKLQLELNFFWFKGQCMTRRGNIPPRINFDWNKHWER